MEISKPAPLKPTNNNHKPSKTIKSLETSTDDHETGSILHTNELAFLYNSLSVDETSRLQQYDLPQKKAKLKKIKGSGFKINKANLLSSQSERPKDDSTRSHVDKDMIILAIKQLQNKMSKTNTVNKIEHFDLQRGVKILTPKQTQQSNNHLNTPKSKPLPKIIRQKSSNIYKLPKQNAESTPTVHHNSYTKYLAGKSNLNLKTDISFRRNHPSRENLEYSFLKEATPDTGYMNFLNKTRMSQLTSYQKSTSSSQKLPLVAVQRPSNDNLLTSDSFNHSITKSTSKFNEISRTSFDSIDFVKKISPQNKYDLPDVDNSNQPSKFTQQNYEYVLDFSTVDVMEKKHVPKVNISAPCTTPLATPISDILHLNKINEMIPDINNNHMNSSRVCRTHRTLIEKNSSDRRKTKRNRPRNDLNANFLSNSMHNLTFNSLNESIQTHLNDLKKGHLPSADDDEIPYQLETSISDKDDIEPPIPQPRTKSAHDKLSEMNDKLYLDIFIPCIR